LENRNVTIEQVQSSAGVRMKLFSLFPRKIDRLGETKWQTSKRTSYQVTTRNIMPNKSILPYYKFQNSYSSPTLHPSLLPAKTLKKSIQITPKTDTRSFSTRSTAPAKKRLHVVHPYQKRLPRG
jgi:hypothetical protein